MFSWNFLLVMKDSTEALKISENMESWSCNSPTVVKSLQKAIKIVDDFDVILMDINFKNEFENNTLKMGKEIELPLIYIRNHSEAPIDKELFKEHSSSLFIPFNFNEFKTAVEIAIYKQNIKKEDKTVETELLRVKSDSLNLIEADTDALVNKDLDDLITSERRLKTVLDGSPIPQFVIGKDHRVIYWNKALEEISGIKSDQVIGTSDHWKAFYNGKRPCLADLIVDGSIKKLSQWYGGDLTSQNF